jgi:uncharacterized protein (DUF2267 family)
MGTGNVDVFDSAVQETHVWLNDVMDELGWADQQRAYLGLRGVLHALRDQLTVDESAQLSAQLPIMIRGIYYEGWQPARVPIRERKREEFLNRVSEGFSRGPRMDPERMTRAVMDVIAHHVSPGQAESVRGVLPEEVRNFWPELTSR